MKAARKILPVIAGALAGMTVQPLMRGVAAAIVLAALGWKAGELPMLRARRQHEQAVRDALPFALDLLVVALQGGMAVDPALRLVAGTLDPGPVADAFGAGVQALDVGLPRDDAYAAIARSADAPAMHGLVRALRQADRYGSGVSEAVGAFAAESREQALADARERALGAPVRMLFPLTLCFLPAFILLAIAPSLLVAVRSFRRW